MIRGLHGEILGFRGLRKKDISVACAHALVLARPSEVRTGSPQAAHATTRFFHEGCSVVRLEKGESFVRVNSPAFPSIAHLVCTGSLYRPFVVGATPVAHLPLGKENRLSPSRRSSYHHRRLSSRSSRRRNTLDS